MSHSILSLQQNGDLQRIKDKWLGSGICITSSPDTINMSFNSYGGLFIVIVVSYVLCISLRFLYLRRNQGNPRNMELDPHRQIVIEMRRNPNPYAIDA